MGNTNKRKKSPLIWVLVLVGVVLIGYSAYRVIPTLLNPPEPPAPSVSEPSSSVPEPSSSASEPEDPFAKYEEVTYPVGKLVNTQDRIDYAPESMTLRVPRLELTSAVLSGVDDATLTGGVGIYDYGMLPGEGNRNVSIAAHRDIHGAEFLKIDTITEGDLMYLDYQGKQYTYEYTDTVIVKADNWDPIRVKDFNALTLTSCDPIGTSLNRICVTGRLIAVDDLPADTASSEAVSSVSSAPASQAAA